MSLKTTVQRLRNRDEALKAAEGARESFVDQWRADVAAVFDQIRSALSEFQNEGAVSFGTSETTVFEEELGEYTIDQMIIRIVNRTIQVTPIARITIGGTGRIDMFRDDRPSEQNRIFIVRGTLEAGHQPQRWLIESMRNSETILRAITLMVRGARTYREMEPQAVQDAVDFLLNIA